MPTLAQLRELPEVLRLRVPRDWEDINGHVNVQHYTGMYDRAGTAMMALLGIDEDWVRRGRIGLFDLEHHIWFWTRSTSATRSRCTPVSRLAAPGVPRAWCSWSMKRASGWRACSSTSTAANLDSRRTAAWPDAVAACIDAEIARTARLGWPLPGSGAISV